MSKIFILSVDKVHLVIGKENSYLVAIGANLQDRYVYRKI